MSCKERLCYGLHVTQRWYKFTRKLSGSAGAGIDRKQGHLPCLEAFRTVGDEHCHQDIPGHHKVNED